MLTYMQPPLGLFQNSRKDAIYPATTRAVSNPELLRSLTIVGPALLTAQERNAMRQFYLAPFNKRVADGSHLL